MSETRFRAGLDERDSRRIEDAELLALDDELVTAAGLRFLGEYQDHPGLLVRGNVGESTAGAGSGGLERQRARADDAQVLQGAVRRHPPTRRALQEPELQQVRLHHVLDRVGLLPHRSRERGQADGPAAELLREAPQDRVVQAIEPALQRARCAAANNVSSAPKRATS